MEDLVEEFWKKADSQWEVGQRPNLKTQLEQTSIP